MSKRLEGIAEFELRHLALVGLEGNETGKSDAVTEELQTRNGIAEEEHRAEDEQDVLDDTGKGESQGASSANKEDGSNVETEGDAGVGEQHKGAEFGDLEERNKTLGERKHQSVDSSAHGSKVVEGDERVHLEALEENLDHDETRGLESNRQHLADETRHGKCTLAVRSEGNTERDAADNHGKSAGELLEAESERDEQNCNRRESLQHLDEADAKSEVSHVAENEGAGEKGTNG